MVLLQGQPLRPLARIRVPITRSTCRCMLALVAATVVAAQALVRNLVVMTSTTKTTCSSLEWWTLLKTHPNTKQRKRQTLGIPSTWRSMQGVIREEVVIRSTWGILGVLPVVGTTSMWTCMQKAAQVVVGTTSTWSSMQVPMTSTWSSTQEKAAMKSTWSSTLVALTATRSTWHRAQDSSLAH